MSYDKLEEIGRGGFGIVYKVRSADGQELALKELNVAAVGAGQEDDLRRRFEREVRYQHGIDHPNVVPISDFNLKDDPPWFVMPLAKGSFADELQRDRHLGGDPRKPLFDILSGIEALHKHAFCHRDLKPANVLCFETSSGEIVYKISDFGLTTPGAGMTSTLTASNMAGGTVLYRPPECAVNFRRATAQADIYSFGAILHDIFGTTTRMPHSELTVAGDLGPVVEKCTKIQARRRYRSAEALREDLYDVLSRGEIEFESQEEEELISILLENETLTDDQWDRLFNQLDKNAEEGIPNRNIFQVISRNHIRALFKTSPDMAMGLGELFCEFTDYQHFDFDYCDVISDKAQMFFDLGDTELKAKIAVAMLCLGVSHNRWKVERQFLSMASPDADEALIQRMRIELQVRHIHIGWMLGQLFVSINASKSELHTVLAVELEEEER